MNKDTDEALEDTNSLLKMIGGIKKKEDPKPPQETFLPPVTPAVDGNDAEAGDFSALLKKLGMAKKEAQSAPVEQPAQPAPAQYDEMSFSDMDDLLEDSPQQNETKAPPSPDVQKPDFYGKDVRASLGKLLNNTVSPPVPLTPAPESAIPRSPLAKQPVSPPVREEEPVVEIIDEDSRESLRKSFAKTGTPAATSIEEEPVVEIIDEDPKAFLRKSAVKEASPAAPPAAVKDTEYDEKIISVDQITDFTGLILPKGATFKIEEL
ncbi:MAG: hypothetical protein Q8R70_10330, partial [Methanoregula sp.]|nr:hypothetical protein [Methanoregula sp.]